MFWTTMSEWLHIMSFCILYTISKCLLHSRNYFSRIIPNIEDSIYEHTHNSLSLIISKVLDLLNMITLDIYSKNNISMRYILVKTQGEKER